MSDVFRKILKWLVYAGATGIMLLALLVGVVRLFLPLVPEYQDDIRDWAAQATGFDVQFENISASWPFAGPELHFINVIVSSQETGEAIFVADELTVGISLFMLVRDRKALLNRVGIEGSQIRIHRDADGSFRFQDRALEEFVQFEFDPDEPLHLPDLLIELSGIDVSFVDETRSMNAYSFGVEQLDIQLSDDWIMIDGEARLAPEFGSRVMVSIDLPTRLLRSETDAKKSVNQRSADRAEDDWQLYIGGEELQFENIFAYALDRDLPVTDFHGDVTISVALNNRTLQSVTAELDIEDIVLRVDPMRTVRHEALSGQLAWQRDGESGWLLVATDISVERRSLFTPRSDFSIAVQTAAQGRDQSVKASAKFLRLQDLYPFIRVAENENLLAATLSEELNLPQEVYGDVQNFDISLHRIVDEPAIYSAAFKFSDVGVIGVMNGSSLRGISGELAMDQEGGRLQIDGQETGVELPALFTAPIDAQSVTGLLVWHVNDDVIRVMSDNVQVRMPFFEGAMHFELDWPHNGDSPQIDLTAKASASDAPLFIPLLPLKMFPAPVAGWLENAIVAGRIPRADIKFSGPLREFPFAADEGVFYIDIDVEDGVLDYAHDWPRVDALDARVVFDGVSVTSQRNNGHIGRIGLRDIDVRMADMRKGLLEISGQQLVTVDAGLDFLRQSPVSDAIGPLIDQVTGGGTANTELQLVIPVTRLDEFDLEIKIEPNGADLGLTGLDWGLTDLAGAMTVRNTHFFATGLTATLLGEPITLDLRPAAESSELYGQFVRIAGRTPVERWMQTLSMPFAERISGPADWNALVLIPRRQEDVRPPVHIIVRSDLVGVESRLPDPLAKLSAETRALEIDIAFPGDDQLEVAGRMPPELTWAFDLESIDQTWQIARGAVHAGSAAAIVPVARGVELTGRLKFLRFDDWLSLPAENPAGTGTGQSDWQDTWHDAVIDIDLLSAFGQTFADVELEAHHDELDWKIELEGPAISGWLTVPLDLDTGRPMEINMERLWLVEQGTDDENTGDENTGDQSSGDQSSDGPADPRAVPSMQIEVGDFVINDLHFGSLSATVQSIAGGILIDPIQMQAETFKIDGDGAWLVHPNDDTLRQSHLTLSLEGTDIESVLSALGYDPVIGGKTVTAQADLTWLGGPSSDFLHRADGTFSISMKDGAVLELEPGGGRILGVLSLAALPRRLSLDFSDTFGAGLSFDTLKGDFTIDDGNAYTCNLGLEGSVADMGIVGRTGIEAQDYDQLAVVRPHVSRLFAVGGVVVGGPVVGAAMLLFSQIFQKPLSKLGESYYRIKGPWDDPLVEQIRGNDLDVAPLRNCEAYLSDAITQSLKE